MDQDPKLRQEGSGDDGFTTEAGGQAPDLDNLERNPDGPEKSPDSGLAVDLARAARTAGALDPTNVSDFDLGALKAHFNKLHEADHDPAAS